MTTTVASKNLVEETYLIVAEISKKGHLEWKWKFMHHLKENTAQTLTESVSKLLIAYGKIGLESLKNVKAKGF